MIASHRLPGSCSSVPRTLVGFGTLIAFVWSLPGCTILRYKPVALKQMEVERDGLVKRRVRLTSAEGHSVTVQIRKVDYPFIWGEARAGEGFVSVRRDEIVSLAPVYVAPGPSGNVESRSEFSAYSPARLEVVLKSEGRVALQTKGGEIWMEVTKLLESEIEGRTIQGRPARFDLRQAVNLELGETDGLKSFGASLGIFTGVMAALLVIVLLTKESCPFVYVDRGSGPELVGEAYPGAAFRSVQRDDLLFLGPVPEGDVRVRLRNEARETQFTDRAELVVVDHAQDVEPLATHDARVLLLKGSMPPLAALVDGRDITAELRAMDNRFWERDVVSAASATVRPTEDSLIVDLPVPPPSRSGARQTVALDLKLGNTPLVDLVFGRFFAAMGQNLKKFTSTGNAAGSGAGITNWLTREGVNLTVEVDDGMGFRSTAVLPPTGPAATRRIAVPVDVAAGARTLRVRLRGGVGFWRFDAVRLASIVTAPPGVTTVAARTATSSREGEALASIAAVDQVHNALETVDETLDLTFRPPPRAAGLERSMFLLTTGYYNIHPPLESHRQIALLQRVRDRPGALSQLGLDLVRDYVRAAERAPLAGSAGGTR